MLLDLFHGTNSEYLPGIKTGGLSRPYLASSPELAYSYGEAADGDGDVVILKVQVDEAHLGIDYASLLEPCGYESHTSKSLEERVEEMYEKASLDHPEWINKGSITLPRSAFRLSLDTVGAVQATKDIQWTAIEVVNDPDQYKRVSFPAETFGGWSSAALMGSALPDDQRFL